MLKVYLYKNCSTCRNAKKWLQEKGVVYEEKAIRETPPSLSELARAADVLGLQRLFNTSGGDYRALALKDRLPTLSREEALKLLSENGNLVKRPFVVGEGIALTGFKEEEWAKVL